MRLKIWTLLLLSTLAWSNLATATEDFISSVYHGGTPYMVVTGTDRPGWPPGLYVRNGDQWERVATGPVMTDLYRGPVIDQLPLSQTDQRFEAFSIVNGRPLLFHILSRESEPETLLMLGSQQAPFREIDTGRIVNIGPITTPDDVSFLAQDLNGPKNVQVILFSLRYKGVNQEIKNLTAAMALKAGRGSKQLELVRDPMILDYDFHDREELLRLVRYDQHAEDYFFGSRLEADSIFFRDISHFKQHGPALKAELDKHKILLDNTFKRKPFDFVSHSLFANTMNGSYLPTIHQNSTARGPIVAQTYDLIHGTGQIIIKNSYDHSIPGLLDLAPENKMKVGPFAVYPVDESILFFWKEGRGYLQILGDKYPSEPLLLDKSAPPNNIALLPLKTVDLPYGQLNRFIVSSTTKGTDGKETAATEILYVLQQSGNTHLILLGRTLVSKQFFDQNDLHRRLDGDFFDANTPSSDTDLEYASRKDEFGPFLDLTSADAPKQLKVVYRKPVREIKITGGITYREYRAPSEGRIANTTGISIDTTAKEDNFISGEPLNLASDGEQYLFNPNQTPLQMLVDVGRMTFKPSVMAVSTSASKDSTPSLAIGVEGLNAEAIPIIKRIAFPEKFSLHDINGVSVVQGSRTATNLFTVLVQIKSPAKELFQTFAINCKAIYKDKSLHFEVTDPVLLSSENEATPDLVDRIVYDIDGYPYLVTTPNLDHTMRRWTVKRLHDQYETAPQADFSTNAPKFDFERMTHGIATSTHSESNWRLDSQSIRRRFDKELKAGAFLAAENLLFGEAAKILDNISNGSTQDRYIFVVPRAARDAFLSYVLRRYTNEQAQTPFNFRNSNMSLYMTDTTSASQELIFDQLDLIQKRPGTKIVLSSINDLKARPTSAKAFTIDNVKVSEKKKSEIGDEGMETQTQAPIAWYLLDAGGPVIASKYQNEHVSARYNHIMFGSSEDLAALKEDAETEEKFGLSDRYKVVAVNDPSPEAIAKLINQLFDQPQIARLNYKFSGNKVVPPDQLTSMSQRDIRNRLLEMVATRMTNFAIEKNKDPFLAFLDFYTQVSRAVVNDVQVRKTQTIDRAFFERILTHVFNLDSNLEDLAPDDPDRLIAAPDFGERLRKNGFRGRYETIAKERELFLAKNGADKSVTIPSSELVIGQPGNFKSSFIRAVIQTLNLKCFNLYGDLDSEINEEANCFFLKVGDLVDDRSKNNDGGDRREMTGRRAVELIEHWLTLDSARRGFLFIDDFDKGTDEIKTQLNQLIRKMTDAKEGFDAYSLIEKSTHRVNLSHLSLRVFMNFQDGAQQPDDFRKGVESAMSSKSYKVDDSHLGRFGAVELWERNNSGGKRAHLRDDLMEGSRKYLRDQQKVILVSPKAIESLVNNFGTGSDARDFIGGAMSGVVGLTDRLQSDQTVVLFDTNGQVKAPGKVDRQKVVDYVKANFTPISLNRDNWDGMIRFTHMVIDSFRVKTVESLINGVRESDRFSRTEQEQKDFLAPTLWAIRDHLAQYARIQMSAYNLDTAALGVRGSSDVSTFDKMVRTSSTGDTPLAMSFDTDDFLQAQAMRLLRRARPPIQRTRNHVLSAVQTALRDRLKTTLLAELHLDQFSSNVDYNKWLRSLPGDPIHDESLGSDMAAQLRTTMSDLVTKDLLEMVNSEKYSALTVYSATRLYLVAMEQAIAELPWASAADVLLSGLKKASEDQLLTQSLPVQKYFFTNSNSLVRPVVTADLIEMLDHLPVVLTHLSEEERKDSGVKFNGDCGSLLADGGVN